MWVANDQAIGFETGEDERIVYTPTTVGAVVAALNAMRWYGPENLSAEARRLYPRFFENAVIRSGLLRASPLPLVAGKYLEAEPASNFAHPTLPAPTAVGVAPVFASQVVYEDRKWKVTDPVFRTSDAMFLVNMLAMRSQGRADPFLPEDRLNNIR